MRETDSKIASAQDDLDELFNTRLKQREAAPAAVFELKEVSSDDRPVLIQCCIR